MRQHRRPTTLCIPTYSCCGVHSATPLRLVSPTFLRGVVAVARHASMPVLCLPFPCYVSIPIPCLLCPCHVTALVFHNRGLYRQSLKENCCKKASSQTSSSSPLSSCIGLLHQPQVSVFPPSPTCGPTSPPSPLAGLVPAGIDFTNFLPVVGQRRELGAAHHHSFQQHSHPLTASHRPLSSSTTLLSILRLTPAPPRRGILPSASWSRVIRIIRTILTIRIIYTTTPPSPSCQPPQLSCVLTACCSSRPSCRAYVLCYCRAASPFSSSSGLPIEHSSALSAPVTAQVTPTRPTPVGVQVFGNSWLPLRGVRSCL